MSTVHVIPERDRIRHARDGADCPCWPVTESVPRVDGGYGWLVIHNALDERPERRPSRVRNLILGAALRLGCARLMPRHWACYHEEDAA